MTYLEHSRYRGVDGVVIACVNFVEPEVVELMQSSIPTVTIDYTFNKTIAVLSNNMEGMSALTQYAVDMGHRRIAYLYGEDSVVTSNRLSGFYITMEKTESNRAMNILWKLNTVISKLRRKQQESFLTLRNLRHAYYILMILPHLAESMLCVKRTQNTGRYIDCRI